MIVDHNGIKSVPAYNLSICKRGAKVSEHWFPFSMWNWGEERVGGQCANPPQLPNSTGPLHLPSDCHCFRVESLRHCGQHALTFPTPVWAVGHNLTANLKNTLRMNYDTKHRVWNWSANAEQPLGSIKKSIKWLQIVQFSQEFKSKHFLISWSSNKCVARTTIIAFLKKMRIGR